jgi:hypothetical protein
MGSGSTERQRSDMPNQPRQYSLRISAENVRVVRNPRAIADAKNQVTQLIYPAIWSKGVLTFTLNVPIMKVALFSNQKVDGRECARRPLLSK